MKINYIEHLFYISPSQVKFHFPYCWMTTHSWIKSVVSLYGVHLSPWKNIFKGSITNVNSYLICCVGAQEKNVGPNITVYVDPYWGSGEFILHLKDYKNIENHWIKDSNNNNTLMNDFWPNVLFLWKLRIFHRFPEVHCSYSQDYSSEMYIMHKFLCYLHVYFSAS